MNIKKVLLIHSAHYDSNGRLVHARRLVDRLTVANVAKLSLPLIAACTPPHIKVSMVEEYFDRVTFDTDADVVGIHAQVMQINRALDLAWEFKKRGKIVVMGGFLPTMHPEMVESHVDSICIGDGDKLWPRMLRDIEQDCLGKRYYADHSLPLNGLPVPRYDLIKRNRFIIFPVQATRGCPFTCDYCSIIQFYNKTYRYRPIDDIIRDMKATGSKQIYFVDDNLMENVEFAKKLFLEMKGLGFQWGTQTTINVANDRELLDLAYASGCRYLALGIESISQKNLDGVKKQFTLVQRFSQVFKLIQDVGIGVHALMVFGFPEDTAHTFDESFEFLHQNNTAFAEFFIMTPYPRTPAGEKLLKEGKIIDTDLSHYRETYVVFKHPHLTSDQIVQGYWKVYERFYSFRSILHRIWKGSFRNKFFHLILNCYYWIKVRRRIVPVYFGRGN